MPPGYTLATRIPKKMSCENAVLFARMAPMLNPGGYSSEVGLVDATMELIIKVVLHLRFLRPCYSHYVTDAKSAGLMLCRSLAEGRPRQVKMGISDGNWMLVFQYVDVQHSKLGCFKVGKFFQRRLASHSWKPQSNDACRSHRYQQSEGMFIITFC